MKCNRDHILSVLGEFSDGDREFEIDVLESYVVGAEGQLSRLVASLDAKDSRYKTAEEMMRAARMHADDIASSSMYVGANQVHAYCTALSAACEFVDIHMARRVLARLVVEAAHTLRVIRVILKELVAEQQKDGTAPAAVVMAAAAPQPESATHGKMRTESAHKTCGSQHRRRSHSYTQHRHTRSLDGSADALELRGWHDSRRMLADAL